MPTVRQRTKQTQLWLEKHFPTPYPVTVRWTPKIRSDSKEHKESGDWAECYRDGNQLIIRLSSRMVRSRETAIETLMHEWAHAVDWPNARVERLSQCDRPHGPGWGRHYQEIYELWTDCGGCEESKLYPKE